MAHSPGVQELDWGVPFRETDGRSLTELHVQGLKEKDSPDKKEEYLSATYLRGNKKSGLGGLSQSKTVPNKTFH